MNDMQNLSLEFADNFLDLAIDSLIILQWAKDAAFYFPTWTFRILD